MPLDSELLDRFERDWNDALEHYEAALRSERMANVHYDPSARIFEASQPAGSSERLRASFLDPIQAKWGAMMGRGGAAPKPTPPKTVTTPQGVFAIGTDGSPRKIIDIEPNAQKPVLSVGDAATLAGLKSALAKVSGEIATDPNPPPSAIKSRDQLVAAITAFESRSAAPTTGAITKNRTVPPEKNFVPRGFIGSEGGENFFGQRQWEVPPKSIPAGGASGLPNTPLDRELLGFQLGDPFYDFEPDRFAQVGNAQEGVEPTYAVPPREPGMIPESFESDAFAPGVSVRRSIRNLRRIN